MSGQDKGISGSLHVENSTTKPKGESQQIDEQVVSDYLRRHPDFFENRPSLLTDLRVPHNATGAVSLVERQVALLRKSNESRQEQLDALIQIARENDQFNSLLHKLTLSLIKSADLEAILATLSKRLTKDFGADLVVIKLFSTAMSVPNSTELAARPEFVTDVDAFCGPFQRLLSNSKPYCGRLKSDQLKVLFDERAESVGSTALLPLGKNGCLGMLVIGSYERNRYNAGADTAFLHRMAETIAAALDKHLTATGD